MKKEDRIVAQQQSVLGRVGGVVAGIAVAQSQGLGLAATGGCALAGYIGGALLDGYLNSSKELIVVKAR